MNRKWLEPTGNKPLVAVNDTEVTGNKLEVAGNEPEVAKDTIYGAAFKKLFYTRKQF